MLLNGSNDELISVDLKNIRNYDHSARVLLA